MKKAEKEKAAYSIGSNLGYMLNLSWRHQKSVPVLCVCIALCQLGTQLAGLYAAPEILSQVEAHGALGMLLGTIAGFAAILLLCGALYRYLEENTVYGRVNLRSEIIMDINDKSAMTSYPNTRDETCREMLHNAQKHCDGNNEGTEAIWGTLTKLLLDILGFVCFLTVLRNVSPVLLLATILTTAAGFAVTYRLNKWDFTHNKEEGAMYSKMHYLHQQATSREFAKDMRIFHLAAWVRQLQGQLSDLYDGFLKRRERNYLWVTVVNVTLTFLRNGMAYGYLISQCLAGKLSAPEFLLYFSAFTGFTQWVTGILEECSTLQKQSLEISQVRQYLNLPEQFRFEDGKPVPAAKAYTLELRNVTFRYPKTEKPILKNLNLVLQPGENIAVVGLNGAGKTTLVKLLCGFYDPDEGQVLLNGQDIRELNRREYYKLFSTVFQDFSDLDITVAETVAQAISGIDMKKVADCIEKAGLSEMVAKLPNGLDTHLGKQVYYDGVELSGGQHQRLMLARALYKDGAVLLLDEPTAALDPIAESEIYRRYWEMTRGKSSVFISHRLASTRFCDRILFLKDGGIAEEGTHEELMQLGGEYAKLFDVQAKYYREEEEKHVG